MFPSPTGNREQNMLHLCKAVAERAGLDPAAFDLKTFRSTYATRMLRQGFDVRTVQDWMGHKSLETTMRYLVPATDVHDRLDEIEIPGITESAVPKKAPGSERQFVSHGRRCAGRLGAFDVEPEGHDLLRADSYPKRQSANVASASRAPRSGSMVSSRIETALRSTT
jgi:hypothetical protein